MIVNIFNKIDCQYNVFACVGNGCESGRSTPV